jgi:hypothetical protein
MSDREADAIYAGDVSVERQATRSYRWDIDILKREVEQRLPRKQWEALVQEFPPPPPQPVYKVETKRLLTLAKKRGPQDEVAQAILRAATIDERAKLVFKGETE